MKNFFKRKKNVYRGVSISGPKLRPATGRCPQCNAEEKEWCAAWCKMIDESWYRQGRPNTNG